MIPNVSIFTSEINETTYSNRTYRIKFKENIKSNLVVRSFSVTQEETAYDRIDGYIDDLDSVLQAVYLILSTERYKYLIYSWGYGVELVDLIGAPMPYVMTELPNRIKDALTQDNRVTDVVDFSFEQYKKKLHTTFTVVTDLGNISTELEVEV